MLVLQLLLVLLRAQLGHAGAAAAADASEFYRASPHILVGRVTARVHHHHDQGPTATQIAEAAERYEAGAAARDAAAANAMVEAANEADAEVQAAQTDTMLTRLTWDQAQSKIWKAKQKLIEAMPASPVQRAKPHKEDFVMEKVNGVPEAVLDSQTQFPTAAPTPAPTVSPTAAPTVAATSTPTPVPTPAPVVGPTPAPTPPPTAAPTPEPTGTPTSQPTETPTTALWKQEHPIETAIRLRGEGSKAATSSSWCNFRTIALEGCKYTPTQIDWCGVLHREPMVMFNRRPVYTGYAKLFGAPAQKMYLFHYTGNVEYNDLDNEDRYHTTKSEEHSSWNIGPKLGSRPFQLSLPAVSLGMEGWFKADQAAGKIEQLALRPAKSITAKYCKTESPTPSPLQQWIHSKAFKEAEEPKRRGPTPSVVSLWKHDSTHSAGDFQHDSHQLNKQIASLESELGNSSRAVNAMALRKIRQKYKVEAQALGGSRGKHRPLVFSQNSIVTGDAGRAINMMLRDDWEAATLTVSPESSRDAKAPGEAMICKLEECTHAAVAAVALENMWQSHTTSIFPSQFELKRIISGFITSGGGFTKIFNMTLKVTDRSNKRHHALLIEATVKWNPIQRGAGGATVFTLLWFHRPPPPPTPSPTEAPTHKPPPPPKITLSIQLNRGVKAGDRPDTSDLHEPGPGQWTVAVSLASTKPLKSFKVRRNVIL
jgi:hypothetical protein